MDAWRKNRRTLKGRVVDAHDEDSSALIVPRRAIDIDVPRIAPPGFGQPDFKMWGDEIAFSFAAGSTLTQEVQLVQVSWERPETWCFFLWLKLPNYGSNAAGTTWTAKFHLLAGLGRTMVDLTDFAQLAVVVPAGGTGLATASFTSVTNPQGQVFLNAPTGQVAFIDHFSAKDVRISALLSAQAGTTAPATVQVGAHVSILNTAAER